ncbi:MAG: hypothetical protein WD428_00155 [Gaiellaceae bacterium]
MRTRLTAALLALVASAALAAAGCGGGGGSGDRLTAAEFRQAADAICAEYDQKIQDLGEPESLEDLTAFIGRAIPIIEEGFNKLEELQPPEELEADWNRAMEVNAENLQLTKDLQAAAESGNDERVQEILAQASQNEEETDRLARELGLQRCGEEGTES